jgi:hypothetical protein
MKKSNKVLLIAFLSFLLIITAVHLSLSAKYKKGQFTTDIADKLGIIDTAFAGVQHVVLKDLGNVNLGVSNTASVGRKDKEDEDYTVMQKGTTLYVTGKDFVGHQTRSRTALWITIPSGGSVSATNVLMDTEQDKTVANASMNVTLNNAHLHIKQYQKRLTYDSVSVTALDGSSLVLNNTEIRSLNLRLHKSTLAESGNTFGSLGLAVDTASEISLTAPHLIKAKITSANHD